MGLLAEGAGRLEAGEGEEPERRGEPNHAERGAGRQLQPVGVDRLPMRAAAAGQLRHDDTHQHDDRPSRFGALGRIAPRDVAGYASAQMAGGLAGAVSARAIVPARTAGAIGGAVTHPSVPTAAALALEGGMTAALNALIFGFVSSERRARWAPLAVMSPSSWRSSGSARPGPARA